MTPDQNPATIESLLAQARWLDALARRLVSDPHEADDIVQETWIAALKHPPHASVPMRSWLARVARNFAIQRGRGESARKKREQSVAREEPSMGDSAAIDRAQTHRRLVDAVLALDEPYRSTVVLHYFDHLPVPDIAVRHDVPESTVRTRLSRAIVQLREKFQRESGNGWSLAFTALVPKSNAMSTAASTSAAAWSSSAAIGGIAMATAWKVGLSVAAVIVLGWAVWPSRDHVIVRDTDVLRSRESAGDLLAGDDQDARAVRVALAKSDDAESVGAGAAWKLGQRDTTSLDVHVRWGDDGTPAAGIVVRLNQWGAPDPSFDDAALRTDSAGLAQFDGVFAGAVRVSCDRAVNEITHVVADKAAILEVTIPDGIDIDGLVVDESDVPVADARILISGFGADEGGPDIDRSDARGKFHLRDVNGQRWIAALHDGFGPSAKERLFSHAPGSHADVVLSLTRSRGMVTGIVHDERGEPISGAKVEIRLGNRSFTDEAGRNELKSFPSLQRFTDAAGGFSASDVGVGSVTLSVEARGFVRWQRIYGVDFRGGPIDVRLSPEAIVHGVVRDGAGAPVEQAMVMFNKSPQESSSTYSRVDGSYQLEHLPRGSVEIRVLADEQGEDQQTFDLEPGQDIEWNVTLRAAPSVEGIVTDDLGKPIAGWLVGAIDPKRPGLHLRSTHTNDAGAFSLGNWPEKATAVEVREPEGWFGTAAAVVTGIKAGDKTLAITIPAARMRTAFIRGRLFDMNARPAGSREVAWTDESIRQGRVEFTDSDGRFRLGPLRPGSYAVDFRIEGQAPKSFHGLTLVSAQDLDLGNIHLEHGGSLLVHLHFPPGTIRERTYPSLELRGKGVSDKTSIAMHGDEGRLTTIASGEYDVLFRASELRAPKMHVTITSDHLTEIDVTAEPATSRSVQFILPASIPPTTLVRMRLLDSSGEDVYGGEMEIPVSTPVGLEGLVVGTYSLKARIGEGPITHLPLDITSLEPSMDVIELHLR